jgi:hypothetical protein
VIREQGLLDAGANRAIAFDGYDLEDPDRLAGRLGVGPGDRRNELEPIVDEA